ncbi:MAG: 1-acyl-sn-glycerol-3-phosphate acyltransferase [Bacteroidetes bacterium]|jgi:1-acyl-sn-glycerol-3-phosphate acyltransferase|nr:1-acyl-sn-glycerol-3-phosphate acyltransferase [Bacteroidota bacterium]
MAILATQGWLYTPLRFYVWLCFKLYYKRIEIVGLENIPKNGAVIFAANHQNTFLDALLIHTQQPRVPHFLTRGDLFANPMANYFMRSLKMRPIFRIRDGLTNVKRNKHTFQECFDLLHQGHAVGIFPEGNHDLKFHLRPLQKGFARIVHEAEKQRDFALGVDIIPTGLQYYGNQHARAKVLIQFGKPINSRDYLQWKDDEKAYHEHLVADLAQAMQERILHIPLENYDVVKKHWIDQRAECATLMETFNRDKAMIEGRPAPACAKPLPLHPAAWRWPIILYGAINHWVIYQLFGMLVRRFIKDKEYYGAMKFVIGMIYIPVAYIIQTGVVAWWWPQWAGLYFLSLPISGMVYRDWLAKRKTKIWPST